MLKDITLGQYMPGNTVVHRLDPRTKIALTTAYIVLIFLVTSPLWYVVPALYIALAARLAGLSFGQLLKSIKPLRFIPTLIEETDKIMKAQQARGADFETGNLITRAKAMVPLLVPLFVSAFRRAGELAMAMEARCYHGGEGRTRLRVLRFTSEDGWAFLITAVAIAAVVVGQILF